MESRLRSAGELEVDTQRRSRLYTVPVYLSGIFTGRGRASPLPRRSANRLGDVAERGHPLRPAHGKLGAQTNMESRLRSAGELEVDTQRRSRLYTVPVYLSRSEERRVGKE